MLLDKNLKCKVVNHLRRWWKVQDTWRMKSVPHARQYSSTLSSSCASAQGKLDRYRCHLMLGSFGWGKGLYRSLVKEHGGSAVFRGTSSAAAAAHGGTRYVRAEQDRSKATWSEAVPAVVDDECSNTDKDVIDRDRYSTVDGYGRGVDGQNQSGTVNIHGVIKKGN